MRLLIIVFSIQQVDSGEAVEKVLAGEKPGKSKTSKDKTSRSSTDKSKVWKHHIEGLEVHCIFI